MIVELNGERPYVLSPLMSTMQKIGESTINMISKYDIIQYRTFSHRCLLFLFSSFYSLYSLFPYFLFSSLLFSSLLFSSLFISSLFHFFISLAVSLPGKEPSLPLELTTFQEDVSLHGIELQNMTIPKRKSYFSQK